MPRGWEGYIYLMTEKGVFATGFLPRVLKLLGDTEVEFIDNRTLVDPGELPDNIKKFELRQYQTEAVRSVINNYLGDVYFPRGVISAATNAGKSLIIAGIISCFPDLTGLILINDGTLYKQVIQDMPKFFKNWGYCQGKDIK